MFDFFKPLPVYVKVYPDKIEIINLKTGAAVARSPLQPFSSSRMVVADFGRAEILSRQLTKELGLANKSLNVLIQQMQVWEGGLSEVEKRVLRDLAEQIGARSVYLVTDDRRLSSDEAR
ncbi:MAG TPA: hypothetical protein VFT06_07245, partial [Flavisolibacter sp.]|nr:hypothetical protein [Flavisolibacter sp.]